MPSLRLFLISCFLLMAGCSEPPGSSSAEAIVPPPDCKDACAAGFRWATDQQLNNKVKCRGDDDFGNGCRRAVDVMNPLGH